MYYSKFLIPLKNILSLGRIELESLRLPVCSADLSATWDIDFKNRFDIKISRRDISPCPTHGWLPCLSWTEILQFVHYTILLCIFLVISS